MARKTVLVSDISGAEIADGKGATVRITFHDARKGVRELDVLNYAGEPDRALGIDLAPVEARAEAHVVGHTPGHRRRQLRHEPHAPPQLERVELAHVGAVEANRSLVGVSEPVEQAEQRRLAGARGPDQGGGPRGN